MNVTSNPCLSFIRRLPSVAITRDGIRRPNDHATSSSGQDSRPAFMSGRAHPLAHSQVVCPRICGDACDVRRPCVSPDALAVEFALPRTKIAATDEEKIPDWVAGGFGVGGTIAASALAGVGFVRSRTGRRLRARRAS
jgi:hypothetical protein